MGRRRRELAVMKQRSGDVSEVVRRHVRVDRGTQRLLLSYARSRSYGANSPGRQFGTCTASSSP